MKSIGGFMFLIGVGSFVLNAMGRQFSILAWIDNWGPTVSMAIKIGLAVVGGTLWLIAHNAETKAGVSSSEE